MSLRSQVRRLVIQVATLARADEIALRFDKRNNRARGVVVAMHETPLSLEAQFREQLKWVCQHFAICDLQTFVNRLRNPCSSPNTKIPILFTFDDGRASNYQVAAPILESFGGRGVFFVVPAFAEQSMHEALAFYRSRMNPDSRPGDEQWEDWKPMNPAQVSELASRGHSIGNHTLTHSHLLGLSADTLEREIGESASKIASWTGKPVDAFAWTFGWDSIDANAMRVIRRHHRFCFAPCAGWVDAYDLDQSLIWRRELEVKYSRAEYRFIYSGLADPWWGVRRARLRKILPTSIAKSVQAAQ
jgi:peptidoglycan/xylan/chitin deacetylase (PgdA/CDA1 family)